MAIIGQALKTASKAVKSTKAIKVTKAAEKITPQAEFVADLSQRSGLPKTNFNQILSGARKEGQTRGLQKLLEERVAQMESGLLTQGEVQKIMFKLIEIKNARKQRTVEKQAETGSGF